MLTLDQCRNRYQTLLRRKQKAASHSASPIPSETSRGTSSKHVEVQAAPIIRRKRGRPPKAAVPTTVVGAQIATLDDPSFHTLIPSGDVETTNTTESGPAVPAPQKARPKPKPQPRWKRPAGQNGILENQSATGADGAEVDQPEPTDNPNEAPSQPRPRRRNTKRPIEAEPATSKRRRTNKSAGGAAGASSSATTSNPQIELEHGVAAATQTGQDDALEPAPQQRRRKGKVTTVGSQPEDAGPSVPDNTEENVSAPRKGKRSSRPKANTTPSRTSSRLASKVTNASIVDGTAKQVAPHQTTEEDPKSSELSSTSD